MQIFLSEILSTNSSWFFTILLGTPCTVTIYMEAENYPAVISYNVVAELPGTVYTNEVWYNIN